jgi:hypothetical protein
MRELQNIPALTTTWAQPRDLFLAGELPPEFRKD